MSHLSVHPGVIPLLCLAGHSRAERNFTPWYLECNGSWKYRSESFNNQNIHKISSLGICDRVRASLLAKSSLNTPLHWVFLWSRLSVGIHPTISSAHFVITSEFPNHHSSIQVPSKDFWTESQVSCRYEINRLIIVSISIRDRRPAEFFLGIDRVPNSAFSRPVAPAQR